MNPSAERFERFSLAIFELSRYWHRLTGEEMARYDLKGTHSVYLLTLCHHPEGLTAPELCRLCGRDKADVSRMMLTMERRGLVRKEGVHQNLYRGVFRLTEEGVQAAEAVSRRVSLAVNLAGEGLQERDRVIFYDALERITGNLRRLAEEGLPEEDAGGSVSRQKEENDERKNYH